MEGVDEVMARGKVDIRRLQEQERVRNQGIANNQVPDEERYQGNTLPDYGHFVEEDASVSPLGRQWAPRPMGSQMNRSYFDPKARYFERDGVANARGPLLRYFDQYPYDPVSPTDVPIRPNEWSVSAPQSWRTGKMDVDYGNDRVVSDPPSWGSTYEDYGETQQHASATEGGEQTSFMSPHQRMVERFKNQRPETFFQDMRTDELLMYSRQLGNWASDTVFEGDPASYDYKAIHEELDVIDQELDARHERFKTYLDETRRLIERFGKGEGVTGFVKNTKKDPLNELPSRPKLDSWPPPPGTNLGGTTQDTRPQG